MSAKAILPYLSEPCLLEPGCSSTHSVEGCGRRVDEADELSGSLGASVWNHHCLVVVVVVGRICVPTLVSVKL